MLLVRVFPVFTLFVLKTFLPIFILDQPSSAIHLQERRPFPTSGISKSNIREIEPEFEKSHSYV